MMEVTWSVRDRPLPPVGVAARSPAGRELARRLLSRDDEALARLSGVSAEGLLVLMGAEAELPWADGAVYLGREETASSLLLPTTHTPSGPAALLERALLLRFPDLRTPLAVLPRWGRVVSLFPARPVDRETLTAWLEGG